MQLALQQARCAFDLGEVPVGSTVVLDGQLIGTGHNRSAIDCDPSAHAEVQALRQAAATVGNFRLDGATLYATVEPCQMCCGALLQARVSRLVFGAREPRTGAVVSRQDSLSMPGLDHHIALSEGICADEAAQLLKTFFAQRR